MKHTLALMLTLSLLSPSLAHETEISGDVAGLLHVEPDDAPRAGRPVTAWFELTLRGGTPLKFNQARYTLEVLRAGTKTVLLRPQVILGKLGEAKNKVSAGLKLPQAGRYILVLRGIPQPGQRFRSFTLRFDVSAVR